MARKNVLRTKLPPRSNVAIANSRRFCALLAAQPEGGHPLLVTFVREQAKVLFSSSPVVPNPVSVKPWVGLCSSLGEDAAAALQRQPGGITTVAGTPGHVEAGTALQVA